MYIIRIPHDFPQLFEGDTPYTWSDMYGELCNAQCASFIKIARAAENFFGI